MGTIGPRMSTAEKRLSRFLFPSITKKFLIRITCVAVLAYLFFGHVCIPLFIQGHSMEPTYHSGGFNFCWRLKYHYSAPQRHDVVVIRMAGQKAMLLKRVVALGGERVEFRDGRLHVNGKEIEEPYVRYPCDWNLSPRQVEKDCVYVVGDNRGMPMENHYFGQTPAKRIMGVPLW